MKRIRHWGAAVALGVTASLCLLGSADASTQSITCGMTVTTSITLTSNLVCTNSNPILAVGADGITINLGGHAIVGPGSGVVEGIQVANHSNVTIKNGLMTDVSTGVSLDSAEQTMVNQISFDLGGSRDYEGVHASNGGHNTLTHLTGLNLRNLVLLEAETSDTVSSNTSTGAARGFSDTGGVTNTYTGNRSYGDDLYSFYCSACSGNTYTGNYSQSTDTDELTAFDDEDPAGPETYTSNTVALSQGEGFTLGQNAGSNAFTVENNVVVRSYDDGIDLSGGYYNNGGDPSTFPGSTVTGNVTGGSVDGNGLSVFSSYNTTVSGNTSKGNLGDGIAVYGYGESTVTVTGNTSTNNGDDGFYLAAWDEGSQPTISNDVATGNGSYAFHLDLTYAPPDEVVPWTGTGLVGRNSGFSDDCNNVVCSAPTPPAAGVPAVAGTTVEGQFLTGTKGAWGISTHGQSFTYLWLRCDAGGINCTPTSSTGTKYKLLHTDIGSTFEFQVTANDDNGQTVAASPPSGLITGQPPTNRSLPVINVVTPQKTLSGTNGTWTATDTITYAKQWLRCDSSGANCNPIGGATGNQYSIVGADVGNTIRLQVTATANAAPAVATSNPTAVIQGIGPSYISLPTISSTTIEGHTITSTNGTWAGTQPVTVSKQWQRCDADGNNCVNIAGATGSSYTTTTDDVGHELLLSFSAANATASYGSYVGPTGVIQVYAPSVTTQPTISGVLRDGATLTAHTGTWNGGSAATSITYQWFRCDPAGDEGGCISLGAPSSAARYVLTPSDVGNTILMNVEETNSAGFNDASSAVTAVIAGNPPVNTVAPSISGDFTTVGNPLSGAKGTWTGRGPITYSYQWLLCDGSGNNCSAATSPSSTPGTFFVPPPGTTVRFQVTATNVDNASGVVAVSAPAHYDS